MRVRYPGLRNRLTELASTQRLTRLGNKFTYEEGATGLKCSAPYPADPQTILRLGLESPVSLLEVFIESASIAAGDKLVLNSAEYPIISVANWPLSTSKRFMQLIVEEIKA